MKRIKNFINSGFRTTGHSIRTQLYYPEGKPEISYLLVRKYKIFWIKGNMVLGTYLTLVEARESAANLGIKL
jgi:hypothetical protein